MKKRTPRKTKVRRKATKKGGGARRWVKRHRMAYEIIVSLLIVGGIYFGVRGSLSLALRMDEPYRAVISQSMNHGDESWRNYFTDRGYDTSNFPVQGGFERGDLLFIEGVNPLMDVKVGDVVVFDVSTQPIPIVHRVVAINNYNGEIYFTTKGDNNPYVLQIESYIKPAQVLGKVVFVIPYIGNVSLLLQEHPGVCVGIVVVVVTAAAAIVDIHRVRKRRSQTQRVKGRMKPTRKAAGKRKQRKRKPRQPKSQRRITRR